MKKITYSIFVILACFSMSCSKDLSDANINPNQFDLTFPDPLFLASQLNTVRNIESYNNNGQNGLWQYSQWMNYNYGGYDIVGTGNWDNFYLKMLPNLKQLHLKYDNDTLYRNRMAVATIWECYIYTFLVQSYGPVPYRQANQAGIKPGDMTSGTQYIGFDPEDTIYIDLLRRLRTAANSINVSRTTDAYGSAYDNIFHGDNSKWIKLANSLRLRLALDCRGFMKDTAEAMIKDLMAHENNLMTSSSDNATFAFGTSNTTAYSQYYLDFYNGTFPYYYNNNTAIPGIALKMNDYFFTYFRSYSDPRMTLMFDSCSYITNINGSNPLSISNDTLVSNGTMDPTKLLHYVVSYYPTHLGRASSDRDGVNAISNLLAPGAPYFDQPKKSLFTQDHKHMIMSYADVCFLKAEAALLGLGGTSTASVYYNAGLDASLSFWGVSTAAANAYKNVSGIQWGTVGKGLPVYDCYPIVWNIPNDTAKIWVQRWINYFPDQAWDAWVLFRRTRFQEVPPLFNAGANILYSPDVLIKNVPDRWNYPTSSSAITNPVAYQEAVNMLGGDTHVALLRFERKPNYRNWRAVSPSVMTPGPQLIKKFYGAYVENYTNKPGYTLVKTY